MAQENSAARRQERKLQLKLDRKAAVDDPNPRFLIVCEGKETERRYLEAVRCHRSLPRAKITVKHAGVTQPRQILDAAWDFFQSGVDRIGKRQFDYLVAVFDRDDHTTYHDALNRALALDAKGALNDDGLPVRVLAIPSNSCIELWLLLHFEDIRAPVHREECLKRVKQHILGYEKGNDGVFQITLPRLPDAMQRAHRLMNRTNPREDGPWTGMHLLVRLLLDSEKMPLDHPIHGEKPWLDDYLRALGA